MMKPTAKTAAGSSKTLKKPLGKEPPAKQPLVKPQPPQTGKQSPVKEVGKSQPAGKAPPPLKLVKAGKTFATEEARTAAGVENIRRAAMEAEHQPKVDETVDKVAANYKKLRRLLAQNVVN